MSATQKPVYCICWNRKKCNVKLCITEVKIWKCLAENVMLLSYEKTNYYQLNSQKKLTRVLINYCFFK